VLPGVFHPTSVTRRRDTGSAADVQGGTMVFLPSCAPSLTLQFWLGSFKKKLCEAF